MTDNRKINEKIIQYLLLMHFKFIIGGSRYYFYNSNFTYFFRFKFVALFLTFSFICESLFLYIYL